MPQPDPDSAHEPGELTLAQVALRAGVSPGTVRRWVAMGLVPGHDGRWTPAAAAYVRVIARLRARGHPLVEIKQASDSGRLAVGPIENLLSSSEPRYSLKEASRESGLEPGLIRQIYDTMGLSPDLLEAISEEDLQMMRYAAAVLAAGIPLPAFLQLMRVYGQVIAQIADAEVRLVHLYVHEPLMRAGVPSVEIAEEMEGLTREVLPFAAPLMNYLHGRLLAHFVEQDMIGHMEGDMGKALEEGRLRVAIAFADLAGYARLTVERGDEVAVSTVERFVEAVAKTLPADARVIKTLGDEVMVIGSDPAALAGWAVDLASGTAPAEPQPRIGLHYGEALYRDGDYYGRDVNQAARVVARAGGGEVLVTRPVVDMAAAVDGVAFDRIGEVRLKGFSEPTELFTASRKA
ncbi:MAG TPA: adenylate cyclase regulatory domain-containing protein [Solirubrobacteraceae bacterium]